MTTPAPPTYEPDTLSAWWVLGGTFVASTALALVFGTGYVGTMRYVKTTLETPDAPAAWAVTPHSPDQCVDAALRWAAGCRGIKSMCDGYIDRVIAECMESQPRATYCGRVGDRTGTTRFGYQDCAVRGVRRNVDAEGCAAAYRAVASYCENLGAPDDSLPAPATAPDQGAAPAAP